MATWDVMGDDGSAFEHQQRRDARVSTSAPDYENPTDMGGDNVYNIMVVATAGDATDSLAVTVEVTDVDEDGNGNRDARFPAGWRGPHGNAD